MRFFIALEIPNEEKLQFQAIQVKLQTIITQARITSHDKLHLTLAFIGEQPDTLTQPLTEMLDIAAQGISPFTITPAYIDGFPNIHEPHVIWAGVKGDIDKIIILRERIKDGLNKLNLNIDERRFIPHISIAKLDGNTEISIETEEKLQSLMQNTFNPIHISSIKLFESVPNEGFHKHNTLAEVKLQ
ncbi:MAG: RNA 2',3'-cyclic phosphodiesterase [Candidatus Daviesbacteria bacterium]|nr:RNA 2',3'-cyclic phosphodiesterase [Candidatus Daviesbacteria bacterium]